MSHYEDQYEADAFHTGGPIQSAEPYYIDSGCAGHPLFDGIRCEELSDSAQAALLKAYLATCAINAHIIRVAGLNNPQLGKVYLRVRTR